MNIKNTLKDRLFQRFFPALFSRSDEAIKAGKPIVPSMEKYQAVKAELQKLKTLNADMLLKQETLDNDIEALDAQRIEHLSNEAMQGDIEAGKAAGKLLNKIHLAKQTLSDSKAIHANILAKITTEEDKANGIYRECKYELGQYLDSRFSALASNYHELVPEISEIISQIQAVQDLMIQLHSGNSNGFDGGVRLPTIEHGNGNTLEPFLESGSVRYRATANDRKEEILTELRAAGYPTRR